jgi:glycosyltransferase involved in cell wall biosynthesis
MAANRVRYIRKFRPVTYARVFHGAVMLGVLLRAPLAANRGILSVVAHESRWDQLPGPDADIDPSLMPEGCVIIPAHNEATVLARTLTPLSPYAAAGRLELIVACNACTDGTANTARKFPGVRVVEVSEASKIGAMNAADVAAHYWPRLYLDADIEIQPAAVAALFSALDGSGPLASRPEFVYDSRGANWLVRAYYRARFRMPSQRAHLWGAGAYAVTADGHARFGEFPELVADDLFVDSLFSEGEKAILHTRPVLVRTPRTVKGLRAVLCRTYRGNNQHGTSANVGARLFELLRSVRGPQSALDAAVYIAFALMGRRDSEQRAAQAPWERDESSRRS